MNLNSVVFKDISIMVWDIETLPLTADIWRLGEQHIRHNQLSVHRDMTEIICITYVMNDGKPPKALVFDYGNIDSASDMILEFDKLISSVDVHIGKNSSKFDTKHVNTQRLFNGLPAVPQWLEQHDDLETQMRKYFIMPSQSLDFWSKKFGLGGKKKMEWDDWQDIKNGHTASIIRNALLADHDDVTVSVMDTVSHYFFHKSAQSIIDLGLKKLKKMVTYGKKDAADTLKLIEKLWPYVSFKFNISVAKGYACCIKCGSANIRPDRTRFSNRAKTRYMYFYCDDHGGGAGKLPCKDGKYDLSKPMS